MSIEDRLRQAMLDNVYRCILHGKYRDADVVVKAVKIVSPKTAPVVTRDIVFRGYWRRKDYRRAVREYCRGGRIFWHAEQVGRYYEKRGNIKRAMSEYEYLMNTYEKMKIIPLPRGPIELYKLGKWYVNRDRKKAGKYLTLYLRAEGEDCGTRFGIRYKKQAQKLLDEI